MKQRTVGFALVGTVILAIVAACGDGAAAPAPVSTTPTPTATGAGNRQIYDFPAEPGSETGGWDFEIPVPKDWPVTHDKNKATYTDPSGKLVLETDWKQLDQEDPLSGLKAVAKASSYPGYHETRLVEHGAVGGDDAAQWDFTYLRDGVTRQVSVVGIGVGEVLFTIRYEAPQPDFLAHESVMASALEITSAG